MNIIACVKQTPDTAAKLQVENGRVTWGDSPLIVNPWDEFAYEEALLLKEKFGGGKERNPLERTVKVWPEYDARKLFALKDKMKSRGISDSNEERKAKHVRMKKKNNTQLK